MKQLSPFLLAACAVHGQEFRATLTDLSDYSEPDVSGKTPERYKSIIEHHLVPAFGRLPNQKLAPTHIQFNYAKARKAGAEGRAQGWARAADDPPSPPPPE